MVKKRKMNEVIKTNLRNEIKVMKHLSVDELNNESKLYGRRNIMKLIEVIENKDFVCLILEYCNGGDLEFYLEHLGNISSMKLLKTITY